MHYRKQSELDAETQKNETVFIIRMLFNGLVAAQEPIMDFRNSLHALVYVLSGCSLYKRLKSWPGGKDQKLLLYGNPGDRLNPRPMAAGWGDSLTCSQIAALTCQSSDS